jgi:hypothetical protein
VLGQEIKKHKAVESALLIESTDPLQRLPRHCPTPSASSPNRVPKRPLAERAPESRKPQSYRGFGVARAGIEPATPRFSVVCSTN